MKNNSTVEFIVNKDSKTVSYSKTFSANRSRLWDAYTKQEILDQWWAPKPFKSKTKSMDFTVGGKRFYAMVGPDGQERWSVQTYTSITPEINFKMHSAFSDQNGKPDLPGSEWDLTFDEEDGKTRLTVVIYNESLDRLEKMIEMGFQEGSAMALKNLDDLLLSN